LFSPIAARYGFGEGFANRDEASIYLHRHPGLDPGPAFLEGKGGCRVKPGMTDKEHA
jgi:hypothetical protein